MDLKKINIPTLKGPNWGEYAPKIQAAFRIFNCWDVVKGEILTPPPNHTASKCVCRRTCNIPDSKSHLEQKEHPGIGSHANDHHICYLAEIRDTRCHQKHLRCTRDCLWTSGRCNDVPPNGQHGEDSIHRLDGPVVSNTTFSRQLQQDHVEWPQQVV